MTSLKNHVPEFLVKIITRCYVTRSYPTDINFEPTTACNLKCKYCPRHELIRKGIRDVGGQAQDLEFEQDLVPLKYTQVSQLKA
jgi:MoaA/NifB/PqqE/SkfB family radical SAM enzyme